MVYSLGNRVQTGIRGMIVTRSGAHWKNPRFRKHGGGDVYIEESHLKAIKSLLGTELEYASYPLKGGRSIIVKFRKKLPEKENEIKRLASIINKIIGASLRRAFGRNANPNEEGYVDGLITAYFLTGELDVDGFAVFDLRQAFRHSLPVAGCDLLLDGFPLMCPVCGHRGVRSDMEARQVSP